MTSRRPRPRSPRDWERASIDTSRERDSASLHNHDMSDPSRLSPCGSLGSNTACIAQYPWSGIPSRNVRARPSNSQTAVQPALRKWSSTSQRRLPAVASRWICAFPVPIDEALSRLPSTCSRFVDSPLTSPMRAYDVKSPQLRRNLLLPYVTRSSHASSFICKHVRKRLLHWPKFSEHTYQTTKRLLTPF